MSPNLSAAFPFIIIALVVLVLVVWLIMRMNRKTEIVGDEAKQDVLDEGAAPAQRNQALIDAPTATEPLAKVPQEPEPEPAPAPASTPAPAPAPKAASASGDDLTQIKGLGPKLAGTLGEMGVTSFAQIAAWTDSDVEEIDAKLGRFQGRITRDQWIEQAKLLISSDKSAFENKYGSNG